MFSKLFTVISVMKVQDKDLDLAKLKLIEEDLSLVIVNQGKVIFKTQKQGIAGFLEAIEKLDKKLVAASVADKIVGVAAAMLSVYAGVASVFALTISEAGRKLLRDSNIVYRFEKMVPNILNRNKKDVCPFEKLAMMSGDPEEAYVKLKSCASQMIENTGR
jgi:UDP-3-O-acyl-N-acetylglucosamine deacetylase